MIAVALAFLAYAAFLALVWCACILAGRADARQQALDEHAEFLGLGADSFPHDRSNGG